MKKQISNKPHNKLNLRRLTVAELSTASGSGDPVPQESISSHVSMCGQTSWLPGCKSKV